MRLLPSIIDCEGIRQEPEGSRNSLDVVQEFQDLYCDGPGINRYPLLRIQRALPQSGNDSNDCSRASEEPSNRGLYNASRALLGEIKLLADIPFKRFCVHLPDGGGLMRISVDDQHLQRLNSVAAAQIGGLEWMTLGEPHPLIEGSLGAHRSSDRVHTRAANVKIEALGVRVSISDATIAARTSDRPIICRRHRIYANVLMPNGDLQLCCMDYGLEEHLGNLGEASYRDIIRGERFAGVIARLNDPNGKILCRRCEYALPGIYSLSQREAN